MNTPQKRHKMYNFTSTVYLTAALISAVRVDCGVPSNWLCATVAESRLMFVF